MKSSDKVEKSFREDQVIYAVKRLGLKENTKIADFAKMPKERVIRIKRRLQRQGRL